MKNVLLIVAPLLFACVISGCGSSSGGADEGDSDQTQTHNRRRAGNSRNDGAAGTSGSDNPEQTEAELFTHIEGLIANDLDEIIETIEDEDWEGFFARRIDAYILSQVKVHQATYPEREAIKKLYEGFADGVASELLTDLRICKTMTPEIAEEDGGWYSIYYAGGALSAEVFLAYDPGVSETLFFLELPLTTPWGTAQAQSDLWNEWLGEVDASSGGGRRNRGAVADPHLNPAAVLYGINKAFGVDSGQVLHEMEAYAELLTPDSRRIMAAILYKRLLDLDQVSIDNDAFIDLCSRHQVDGEGITEGFAFPDESDSAFYREFAARFPTETSAAFIAEADAVYEEISGKACELLYPAREWQTPRPEVTDDGVWLTTGWGYTNSRSRPGPTKDILFVEINGKWYAEAYWEMLFDE